MKATPTPGLATKLDEWYDALEAGTAPEVPPFVQGAFEFTTSETGQRHFWFVCPGKCKQLAPLLIRPVVAATSAHSWESLGTEEKPTLHPSINHVGCWHGWLKDGEFTEC